jgi:hypothetical protein
MAPPICTDVNIKAIAAILIALIRSFIGAPSLVFNDASSPDARIGAWIEVVGREHRPPDRADWPKTDGFNELECEGFQGTFVERS